jgi:hypothetical protein
MKINKKKYSIAVFVFLLSYSCSNNEDFGTEQTIVPFINPVFENVNIPFEEYSISAEKGDTIYYKTGSIIIFPPNAFIDDNGNIVTGDVKINYREFSDPIDFFVSGIPMEYDSSGTKYIFESSGMCEVNAYKDNAPLFVNPKSKPEINLAVSNNDNAHNLYYLDTLQKKWINRGKDIISEINNKTSIKKEVESKNVTQLQNVISPPIKPIKASGDKPVFEILIEPGSLQELQAYNNLKFEIDNNEDSYLSENSDIEWEDVNVKKGNVEGQYIVTFTKGKRKASYVSRPVFEGKDYEEALKIFEKKDKEYQSLLSNRLKKEKEDKKKQEIKLLREKVQNEKIQKENERIEKLNLLIIARNKKTEENNKIITEKNNRIEEKNKISSEIIKKTSDNLKSNEIIRSFSLEGFGIWNCDKPQLISSIPVLASFKDKAGNKLDLLNITVVYKGMNGVYRSYNSNIQIIPNSENMIWSVLDNNFVCLSYDEFKNYNVNSDTKEITFEMKTYNNINSIDDIKKIINL